jgi:two-component system, OmpR family, response regulator VicR
MPKTKILYVEDEPFLGKIVKESLESRDFDVKMVADGRHVLAAFQLFKPEICVLDIMLPHVDGYTLAKDIRHLSPTMPIIFLTAKTQTEDVLKGFEVGGNDFIRKPFSMEELIVRIQSLLKMAYGLNASQKESSSALSEPISIGQFEFLPFKYELRLGDSIRKLSHRESELLKILHSNRQFTVNRKDILLKIWGDDSFFNSRNLDVYITKLREYLKADPAIEIMTVKGVGYNFIVESIAFGKK